MSGKNGKIHYSVLSESQLDTVELAKAVEDRFLVVFHLHMKICGSQLDVPHELKKDLLRWREMCVRHRRGDYRNTISELESTRSVAQWALDVNCKLRNQPVKKIAWSD